MPQRNHLPHAQRLPVELPAQAVRRRFDDPSLVSDLDERRHVRAAVGALDRTLRGTLRRRVEVAGRRRDARQSAVWGVDVGRNPTDRGKNGTKKSLLVDGQGGPLAAVTHGANWHDATCLEDLLDATVVACPEGQEQNLCLDKGYDNPTGLAAVAERGYEPHIQA